MQIFRTVPSALMGLFLISLFSITVTAKEAGITTEEIKYNVEGTTMIGYLAQPKMVKPGTPAVLVVHEWWGQTDYPRKRARMLAEMGYIAFAVDMYGDRQITDHPKEAGAFSKAVFSSAKNVRVRFDAALNALLDHSKTKSSKVAAIGYCFGGSVVLEMARQGVALAGVASFHGGLNTPTKASKKNLKTKILVLHGAADPLTKKEGLEAFHHEMKSAEADYQFISYEGAKHGFTNPEAELHAKRLGFKALGYSKKADEESWKELESFFKTIF